MQQKATDLPIVNTHVHIPPNFSAFTTLNDVLDNATAQGVSLLGVSNFYDQQVYSHFESLCAQKNIRVLFGLEFITIDEQLTTSGTKINDPSNPGRIYLCGKGINICESPDARGQETAREIRQGNDERAASMVQRLTAHFQSCQVPATLSAKDLIQQIAKNAQVDPSWVSLQERHIARAYQELIAALPADQQREALTRVYGRPPQADPGDAVATQSELRTRLLKVGTAGFVPEVPLSFTKAYDYILARGGIPTYPILADGAPEISPFEAPAKDLAAGLLERGIYAAELITHRNSSAIVQEYVEQLTKAGILVMAGTEHNTLDKIDFLPRCADAELPPNARQAFYRGTCVAAAHQHLVQQGLDGYVDNLGHPVGVLAKRQDELARLGDELIRSV